MGSGRNSRSFRSPLPGSLAARRKIWANFDLSFALVANTPILADMLADVEAQIGADLVGVTVLRSIGWVQLSSGNAQVAFGKFPDMVDAVDISPTASPYLDWYFYRRLVVVGGTDLASHAAGYQFDISSRRRLDEVNESLFFAAEGNVASAGVIHNRMLLALP